MFWFHGQFSLCVLSPEKYVTISVRTQQSNGKAIGHGSFFLRRPKNSKGNTTHANNWVLGMLGFYCTNIFDEQKKGNRFDP